MTLDTSAWKIDDPEWVKEREQKWPIFEEWIKQRYSMIDYHNNKDLTRNISNSKSFYMTGFLNSDIEKSSDRVGFENSLALIPNIQWNTVRQILRFYIDSTNRIDFKGCFFPFYLAGSKYIDLIEKEIIDKDFFLQFLKGVYGNSLAEAAQILGFEVKKVCYRVVNDMGPIIFNYYFNNLKTLDFQTANHLIPIYIDALKLLNDEDARNCDFVFSQHVKRKRKYYDAGLVSDPDRLAIMNRMLVEIKKIWNELNPIVQEKLSPLVE